MRKALWPVAPGADERSARDYSAWFESPLGRLVWADEQAVLRPLLEPVTGRTVLDAGAGEGRLAVPLAATAARVVGVDASLHMLRLAARRAAAARRPLKLAAARLEALPLRPASFDLAVAVTVLCFARHPGRVARELARVLRPGGRLVIAELGRWSPWTARRWLRGRLGDTRWRGARFWTRDSLHRLVRDVGLDPAGWTSAVHYPPSLAAARLLRPLERALAGRTALGAAFVAVAADKPAA
jgi:SAM-dependent methyltransferase